MISPSKTTEQRTQAATGQMSNFIGAFSIGSATSVASSLGLNADLEYGYNPVAGDAKSSAMKAANLKAVQSNSQIIAYWVLDDTNGAGTAKAALVQVTSLIHQYTPGKPSILLIRRFATLRFDYEPSGMVS